MRNAMSLLESVGDELDIGFDSADVSGIYDGDVGGFHSDVGFDPADVGAANVHAARAAFSPAALQRAAQMIAAHKSQNAISHARETTMVGHIPSGMIAGSTAIGIGATATLTLVSFIPQRIYRIDGSAAVTATGADASGSVSVTSFMFANRGIFDGTGTPTVATFRPDANGRPPVRNIKVFPNTPIVIVMTNNNAAAVTASFQLYGSVS